MAEKMKEKTKEEPVAVKEKRRQKLLERLGFVQMISTLRPLCKNRAGWVRLTIS